MREYARILSPKGLGFIQNPWKETGITQEDPSASPRERVRRFGQADHVRLYGLDFEDRLRSVGLNPHRLLPDQVVTPRVIEVMGLRREMPIWMVFGSASPLSNQTGDVLAAEVRNRAQDFLARF
jgi:hypothetical protein